MSDYTWSKLTDRQRAAIEAILPELREHKISIHHWSSFEIVLRDEIRPGRGHDITWWACDGERVANGRLDVYGNGQYGVGDVDWLHGGEDCECDVCGPAYDEDDTPAIETVVVAGGVL